MRERGGPNARSAETPGRSRALARWRTDRSSVWPRYPSAGRHRLIEECRGSDGRSLPLCQPPDRLSCPLRPACGRAAHAVILGCRRWPPSAVRSARNTASSIWSTRSRGRTRQPRRVVAVRFLVSLIAADNLLWRVASWIASSTFVGVTGDLRRDLFRHLTGHAAQLFRRPPARHADEPDHGDLECGLHGREHVRLERAAALRRDGRRDRLRGHRQRADGGGPGRRSPASWSSACSASPPPAGRCITTSPTRPPRSTARWSTSSAICRWSGHSAASARASPLRRDGRSRDDGAQRSLLYLEKLRLFHAVVTVVLTIGLLAWAIVLWQRGAATDRRRRARRARSACRSCTRRAIWRSRWSMSPSTWRAFPRRSPPLLVPHELRDHPEAAPLVRRGASVDVRQRLLRLSGRPPVFEELSLFARARPARRAGRPIGRRQVDALRAAAAVLRRAGRPHPDRRPGHLPRHAGEPASGHRGRAAGHLAVPSLRHGEHSLRPAGRVRRGGVAGRHGGAMRRFHRRSCRRASTPSSATAASSCRAASASASRSPARF